MQKRISHTALRLAIAAVAISAAAIAGAVQGATALPGDKYGYEFHTGTRSAFTDGARSVDPFLDGAKSKVDPYTDGARVIAAGPANPADRYGYEFRTGPRNAFTDGARGVDPYTDGARVVAAAQANPADRYGYEFRTGPRSAFTDGARGVDPFLDGARA